jgi:hypothetical protein
MKRRHFLQFSASALAAMGLSQTNFLRQANHYGKALAESTPRKLALLVGVNAYPEGISPLQGCLTDVRMQYELLVHRFGFNPSNILILSDPTDKLPAERIVGSPTRHNILQVFDEHLIKQAKDGDVVVFHYSGHGSRVIDPKPIPEFAPYNGTMMPYDARNPASPAEGARDIMGKTLFLLTYALKTDNVTTVLDSCHSGGGTRGGLTYRAVNSRYGDGEAEPHSEELAYQETWMTALDLSEDKLLELRSRGVAKGFGIGSTQDELLAAEAIFGSDDNRFVAGAFTYTLTRYLWQQSISEPIDTVRTKLALSTRDVARENRLIQEPIFEISPSCPDACDRKPIYFLSPDTPAAEAVVTSGGREVQFWMGGISSRSLEAFTPGAVFNLVDAEGTTIGTIEQTNRKGLVGTGVVKEGQPAAEGLFLQEKIRGVPANPELVIALDPSLGADASIAESALRSVNRIKVVLPDGSAEFDYIFGRMGDEARRQAADAEVSNLPPDGSLCLFAQGLVPVPDSWRADGAPETIAQAVTRLEPRLKMLLAGRILKYVLNTDTSDLKIDVQVVPVNGRGVIGSFGSRGAREAGLVTQTISTEAQPLLANTAVKIQITNDEEGIENGLYMAVLVVGSSGDLTILHPLSPDAAEVSALISPNQTLEVPELRVLGPAGFFELLVLASTEPLRDALKALEQVVVSRGGEERFYSLEADEAVNVMDLLLRDLDRSTRAGLGSTAYTGSARGVDTTKLAAISAIFEVVE